MFHETYSSVTIEGKQFNNIKNTLKANESLLMDIPGGYDKLELLELCTNCAALLGALGFLVPTNDLMGKGFAFEPMHWADPSGEAEEDDIEAKLKLIAPFVKQGEIEGFSTWANTKVRYTFKDGKLYKSHEEDYPVFVDEEEI